MVHVGTQAITAAFLEESLENASLMERSEREGDGRRKMGQGEQEEGDGRRKMREGEQEEGD